MDKVIFDGIDKFGFTVIFALLVMYALYKMWGMFYKTLADRIEKLESSNLDFRKETNHSRELLDKALDSFNDAVKTFKQVQNEVQDIKDDISDIKDKISKK